MVIFRHVIAQQFLQQTMQVAGKKQVLTTSDEGYALQIIIMGNRDMIAGRGILACQNHIAKDFRGGDLFACRAIKPCQFLAHPFDRSPHIKAKCIAFTGCNAILAFGWRTLSAGPGIKRAIRAVWCVADAGDFRLNVLAGAKARIKKFHVEQAIQHRLIIGKVIGLHPNRFFPFKAKPGEVFIDRIQIFRTTPGLVDIFDPQKKTAIRPGLFCRKQG